MMAECEVAVAGRIIAPVRKGVRRCTIIWIEAENAERQQLGVEAIAEHEDQARDQQQKQRIHGGGGRCMSVIVSKNEPPVPDATLTSESRLKNTRTADERRLMKRRSEE